MASATYRHALKQTDVKAEPARTHERVSRSRGEMGARRRSLVPLNLGAGDADKRERNARLPLLWRVEDQVVERLSNLPVMSKECEKVSLLTM